MRIIRRIVKNSEYPDTSIQNCCAYDVTHSRYGRRFRVDILHLPLFSYVQEQEICFAPFVCWNTTNLYIMNGFYLFSLNHVFQAKTVFLAFSARLTPRNIYGYWAIGYVMEAHRHREERITSRHGQAAYCTRQLISITARGTGHVTAAEPRQAMQGSFIMSRRLVST